MAGYIPISQLSPEDRSIIHLVRSERTAKDIGKSLNRSESFVKKRLQALFDIYHVDGRVGLVDVYYQDKIKTLKLKEAV